MAQRYSGIYPMLYPFYNADLTLDAGALRAQVDHVVASGAHGIAILGLASEVFKLDVNERRAFMDLVATHLAGRRPLAVTIAEPSVPGQAAFARAARAAGADWVILQLPSIRGAGERDYIEFIGAVAAGLDLPGAVQNNPVNMDVSVSSEALLAIHRAHPNVSMMKAEGSATAIAPLAAVKTLGVFGGRNGMEMLANLKAGCVGNVPAPEMAGPLARIHDLFTAGRVAEAEAVYRAVLPLIVFVNQNLAIQLCYGKRLLAQRLGLATVHERAPATKPTGHGLAMLADFARMADEHLPA